MSDMAQTQLAEPNQIDWDNYNPTSKWIAPPPALGVDGAPITYFGQIKALGAWSDKDFGVTKDTPPLRQYQVGPLTLVKSGASDGYLIRFAYVSTKQFEKNGKPINASSVGNFLKSAGLTAKPQTNAQYDAAIRATSGRVVSFTIDWEARNKDTGEEVRGYLAFPDDPTRPGQKKAILRGEHVDEKGNTVPADRINVLGPDYKPTGETVPVTSDILFANARIRFYRDPNKK